jgi:hypothetical protein
LFFLKKKFFFQILFQVFEVFLFQKIIKNKYRKREKIKNKYNLNTLSVKERKKNKKTSNFFQRLVATFSYEERAKKFPVLSKKYFLNF